jgi:hypothetical protein
MCGLALDPSKPGRACAAGQLWLLLPELGRVGQGAQACVRSSPACLNILHPPHIQLQAEQAARQQEAAAAELRERGLRQQVGWVRRCAWGGRVGAVAEQLAGG